MDWSFLFSFLMYLVMLACIGFSVGEGMWSNGLRLINLVTAALLAMNFYEPVANWLESNFGASYTYWWDFIALWGVFALSLVILRAATDQVSRVKVKFLRVVDRVGSVVLSIVIGWIMVCFVITTLHASPMSRAFLAGSFDPAKHGGKLLWTPIGNVAPDLQWLGFTQKVSTGAFCRSVPTDQVRKYMFDPEKRFREKYGQRRQELENRIKWTGSALVP
jgi:hypothetical protein